MASKKEPFIRPSISQSRRQTNVNFFDFAMFRVEFDAKRQTEGNTEEVQ